MLKARKTQITTIEQKSQILAWKQTDYQTVYSKVKDLGDTAFNNTLVANLAPLKATNTNEAVATATVTASTDKLSHQLTVKQLAGARRNKEELYLSSLDRYIAKCLALSNLIRGIRGYFHQV